MALDPRTPHGPPFRAGRHEGSALGSSRLAQWGIPTKLGRGQQAPLAPASADLEDVLLAFALARRVLAAVVLALDLLLAAAWTSAHGSPSRRGRTPSR